MHTVSHTVSHSHVVNDDKNNSILNKIDNINKKLNKRKFSYSDRLDNKVCPHMPIDSHHSTMFTSEVNKLYHLEEATLLRQFYMENTHYPPTQSHAKDNLFIQIHHHQKSIKFFIWQRLLANPIPKRLLPNPTPKRLLPKQILQIITMTQPPLIHFFILVLPRRCQVLNSESWANSQELNP